MRWRSVLGLGYPSRGLGRLGAPSESAFLWWAASAYIRSSLTRFIFLAHRASSLLSIPVSDRGATSYCSPHSERSSSVDYRHPTSRGYTSPIRVSACTLQTLEHTISSPSPQLQQSLQQSPELRTALGSSTRLHLATHHNKQWTQTDGLSRLSKPPTMLFNTFPCRRTSDAWTAHILIVFLPG